MLNIVYSFSFVLNFNIENCWRLYFCDIELSLELLLILCGYFDAEWWAGVVNSFYGDKTRFVSSLFASLARACPNHVVTVLRVHCPRASHVFTTSIA